MDGRARHAVLEGEKEKLLRLEDVLHERSSARARQ